MSDDLDKLKDELDDLTGMSDRVKNVMDPATEDVLFAVLKGLAAAIPPFASWLFGVTQGRDDVISRRVRDILPEKSASRAAAEDILSGK